MLSTEQLLEQLSKAVSYAYREDGTCPSVLISSLRDKEFYVSIVRYGAQFANNKSVICNTQDVSLREALLKLTTLFLNKVVVKKNPIDSLRDNLAIK